ncbi:MAG: coenzyme F420-0:L-glutamate ligase [Thaumarchaeota archaeon]|nr:coenzyme F420-0:L-glutamate ligase [Nitrososphaerota archaeon]MCY3975697.1 coenzyme F420-0:L-glutamate ligase [Nitrososphaerota archaeon]
MKIIPIHIENEITIDYTIIDYLISKNIKIKTNDVLVISQKIISKQEGRLIKLSTVKPSILSIGIALEYDKDPRIIEVIMKESKKIIRMYNGVIIVETEHGFICANAGVDESNVRQGYVTLLPIDADKSARFIREQIFKLTKKKIAVIISDTFGRPFRLGQTDFAIGVSGIELLIDYIGTKDVYKKPLRVTSIAIVDEICSAAELVMGKINNCPAAILRNYKFNHNSKNNIQDILRKRNENLFV